MIPDHQEGYITWEEYVRNQEQIESNAGWNGRLGRTVGAAKAGPGMLAGMLRCGKCGRLLHVMYVITKRGRQPRYECQGDRSRQMVGRCLSFGGTRVDQAVVAEVLETIRPLGIQAALDAWDLSQNQGDEKRHSIELALQKARYEGSRIERQYEATDPENRLVAGELEKRWNRALAQVADLERSLEETSKYTLQLGDEQRQQLLVLGDDLERVWDHPACPVQLKKRILRTVIKEVVVGATADPPRVILKLHWAGGTHTELIVRKNQTGHHEHVSSGEVIDLIRELSQVCEDGAIVAILNRLGYRTGVANTWNEKRVQHVRHTRGFPACPPPGERRWLTMEQTAQVLDVSMMVVRRLIAQQILPAKQIVKFAPWIIERADLELPSVRKEIRRVHEGRRLASIVHNNNEQHRLFKDAGEM